MVSKVIQEFKGEIDGVEFSDENLFKTCEYLLEKIEEKFGILSNEFIKDFRDSTYTAYIKHDYFSYADYENEITDNIEKANSIKKLKITYYGLDWKFEYINENLRNGKYIFG